MTTPDDIIATAKTKLGALYVYGAKGPDTFDCSGYTEWVYAQHGIAIGGDTAAQQRNGMVVDPGHRQPGDLVFFGDLAGPHAHVGIYLGGDQMIDAPHTGASVRYDSVTGWAASGESLRGYRRYLQPVPLDTPAPAPKEEAMPDTFLVTDPDSGGTWVIGNDGSVVTNPNAPYLGSLTGHPKWNAGTPTDPVIGAAAWKDGNGQWGYVMVTRDASGRHVYDFPRDGRYAKDSATA